MDLVAGGTELRVMREGFVESFVAVDSEGSDDGRSGDEQGVGGLVFRSEGGSLVEQRESPVDDLKSDDVTSRDEDGSCKDKRLEDV